MMGGFDVAPRGAIKRIALVIATLAFLFIALVSTESARAATPTIVNTSNWLEGNFSLGETNNSGNRLWLTLGVKHDVGRKVTGIKIDDDWDGNDNTTSKGVKTLTAQQPTMQGGYDYSRVSYNYAFPVSGTGMSCGAFGIGGTNKTTKSIRVRAVLDNGEETATTSANVNFTRADCSGGEDYPYIYSRSQSASSITPGSSVTFTFKGDDSDGSGNKDFAGVNWRMRRLSDGTTTTAQKVCYGSGQWDNQDKTLNISFPNRGRWVVEAELLNNDGCNINDNSGSWAYIGAVDVNTAAATSPTASLSATRPQLNGNTTVTATFADGSDNGQGGRVQDLEWDLDNNTSNGVAGYETTTLGAWNTGLTSPQSKTINTNGMSPGLKTVRVRATDNGALVGADDIRRQKVATTTYLVDTPPLAEAQSIVSRAGTGKQVTLTGTDVDGDTLDYSIVGQPTHGTITGTGSNLTYTADADYAGPDSFTFKADDGYGGNDTATVDIEVAPQTTIDDPAPTAIAVDHAELNFSSPTAGATFECSFDDGAWEDCESPYEATGLTAGPHTLRVRATAAGNTDPNPAEHTVTVYLTPPDTTIDAGPQGPTGTGDVSFEFSSDVPGSTFECRLDSGAGEAWEDCDSPKAYAGLDEGSYTFSVRATDPAGNVDDDPASRAFSVDLTGPDASLDSGPTGVVNQATANFTFSSSEADATFECNLDDGGWEACESPAQYGNLESGEHTFAVRALDVVGNATATPPSRTWTVDLVDPTITITSSPAASTTEADAEFAFEADEDVEFECRLDGGDWEACESPLSVTVSGEGSHTFQVRGTDVAGNVGVSDQFEWFIDTIAPHTTIDTAPAAVSNVSSPEIAFSADEAGSTFECRIDSSDDADWQSCVSPAQFESLSDGDHRIEVRATDPAGNVESTPASVEFTIDTAAPGVTIDAAPPAASGSPSATFEFSSDEGDATFECRLDGQGNDPFTACESPEAYLGLSDGQHRFEVRAVDQAGNQSTPASHDWTVDVTAPAITITSKPADPSKQDSATIAFEADDSNATFECRFDSTDESDWAACQSPQSFNGLSEGRHTFEVRASDDFGNVSTEPSAWSWTVDLTAPTTTIIAGPPAIGNSATANFAFTADESAQFECRLDSTQSSAWEPCDSPRQFSGLSEGQHKLEVRAADSAGNQGAAASYEWTIDQTKPVVTIDGHPAAPTNQTTAEFGFSSSENGVSFECDLDGAGWQSCTPPAEYQALTEGDHVFRVRAQDPAGNVSDIKTFSWRVILTPPQVSIDQGPAALTNSATANFAFSSNEAQATFECRADSNDPSDWDDCTSPFQLQGLGEGSHEFEVRAIDGVGNVSAAASRQWTVDLTAPVASIGSAPASPVNSADAEITFSADDASATFECRLDSGNWSSCTSPVELTGLSEGQHQFQVRATDLAGNVGPVDDHSWTIDLTKPVVTIDQAPPALSRSATAAFEFSASENATFECDIDESGWQACSSPASFTSLAEGDHSLSLRATDPAGNVSLTVTHDWTVDLTAPTATIDAGPPALTKLATASFEFSADEAGSTFECRLDSGSWAGCDSPRQLNGLSDGDHSFDVRATDPAGNTGAVASQQWTVDLSAPSVAITSEPAALNNQASASFEFESDDADATFECRVDVQPGQWSSCDSPATYGPLAEGSYTFRVRATDPAGNVGPETTRLWTIDLTAPTVAFDSAPPALSKVATADFAFHANEAGTTFECSLDSASWSPCASPLNLTGLSEGAHQLQVRGTDPAGNKATISHDWTVDTIAPDASIDAGPATSSKLATADFEFSAGEAGSTFECRVDSGDWEACTSPLHLTGLSEGQHQFRVRATDPAGNTGAVASRTWTVDLTSPVVTIDQAPAALGNSASASFEFSSDETGTAECSLDDGDWETCSSPAEYASLSEGDHSFAVRVTDTSGNVSQAATHEWTIDLTAPTATIDAAPPALTKQATATFEFSADENATFECNLDGTGWEACDSPVALSGLEDGAHAFEVRAKDGAGNESAVVDHGWTVDTTLPSISIASGPPASTNQTTAEFAFNSNEPGSTFECRLDSTDPAAWSACASPTAYTSLSDGQHRFQVRAIDPAGNISPAAQALWTVDSVVPVAEITAGPQGAVSNVRASFKFSANAGTFQCRVDSDEEGDWKPCTSPLSLNKLDEGPHRLQVRAVGPISGPGPVATRNWTVDTVAPRVTLTSGPAASTKAADARFEFQVDDDTATVTCRVDSSESAAWQPCVSPLQLTDLSDGSHRFEVRAVDEAGNVSMDYRDWAINASLPVVTITSRPAAPTADTAAEFTFTANKPGKFVCSDDGNEWIPCVSPYRISGLESGSHAFKVRVTDELGNQSEIASYEWDVTGGSGEKPKPVLKASKSVKVAPTGKATVASVSCPDGTCTVSAKVAKVKIAKRKYAAKVKAPKTIGAGKAGKVVLVLPKAARTALSKGRGSVRVTLKATSSNGQSAKRSFTVKLRPPKK